MKYINLAKKFAEQKYQQLVAVGTVALLSAQSMAAGAGVDIGAIGTTAATEIAKFAIMISAIGTAVLSVVVLIQGFRMAFGMVRTAR